MHSPVPPQGPACWEGCHFIGNPSIDEAASPFFLRNFHLPEEPLSGTVFLCGLGYHELYLNDTKVGDDFLCPPQSIYDRTVYYNTYDVGSLLKRGDNVLYVLLGNGLYNCEIKTWDYEKAAWKDKPKLLLYADILLRQGKRVKLQSDRSFQTGESPITYNTFYGGETQDYTRADPSRPGTFFKLGDSPLQNAAIVKSPGGILRPFPEPHVREHLTYRPLKPADSPIPLGKKVVFDFGQNMAGWAHVDAEAAGRTRFTLRYGETLDSAGGLDTTRIAPFVEGGRFQTDEYILDAAHPIRDGRPHFTYYGFRYVELSVEEGELSAFDIRARTLNSDLRRIGNFDSSDTYVNRIYDAGQKASLSNLVNIPTDCPHREKNGWTGDAALSAEQMCLNLDMTELYRRWLRDIRDAQRPSGQLPGIVPTGGWGFRWGSGPVWDSALFELPLAVYTCYGDPSLLLENQDAMKRYLDFCASMADDYIVEFGLGDWCPPTGGADGHLCPIAVSDTATYFKLVTIMARTMSIAGDKAGRYYYDRLAARIKDSFNRHFVNPGADPCNANLRSADPRNADPPAAGRTMNLLTGVSQTGLAMALCLGLVEGDAARKALDRLCALVEECGGHLDFGILGARYVFEALSLYGRGQTALDIILKEGFPSYRHWIDDGITTLAETWDRSSSDNHHMFSDVCRWFIRFVAGLDRADFYNRTIVFRPDFPLPLNHAEASTGSGAGNFSCRWERRPNGFIFTCTAPEDFSVTLAPAGQGWNITPPEEEAGQDGHIRRKYVITTGES
ncbi:MAG: glycoside hydrolase family 78 protein [Treponema sp.]|nr:glycoside hydrolase family 78 protein [Treponema sp.]